MENQSTEKRPGQRRKKVLGFAILAVGLALFAREMGAQLPEWLFSWPMLLIVIGIASGIKHRFKNSFWMISLLVGGVFLAERISPELSVAHFTWPAILIGLGIFFIFSKGFDHNGCSRRAKWRREKRAAFQDFAYTEAPKNEEPATDKKAYRVAGGDYLDSVSVFEGTKKNILSKDFKGGEVVNILGGAELNFYNADIEGVVVLDVTQIFGGTKLIIPPTWEVVTEMAAVFGGIDDRRGLNQVLTDRSKVLVIKGTSIFGGIDIRNF
ncbi:hypothetical protein BCY91_13770 [Pelobium manganitolerans]|uniref:LiaF transmembrane domain-containing protein n=1 Tax=Pelobium manganitolerans TaxID=1842495 RepID=A0A419S9T1_9SPHI|nr:DUF5668 domain-containing protein [Pelobium manganitolerans]RKD18946.1 hypothetical protein BCY91_13770 [Pelobium manganitolerans]